MQNVNFRSNLGGLVVVMIGLFSPKDAYNKKNDENTIPNI